VVHSRPEYSFHQRKKLEMRVSTTKAIFFNREKLEFIQKDSLLFSLENIITLRLIVNI
jgi:hypothetical protein